MAKVQNIPKQKVVVKPKGIWSYVERIVLVLFFIAFFLRIFTPPLQGDFTVSYFAVIAFVVSMALISIRLIDSDYINQKSYYNAALFQVTVDFISSSFLFFIGLALPLFKRIYSNYANGITVLSIFFISLASTYLAIGMWELFKILKSRLDEEKNGK